MVTDFQMTVQDLINWLCLETTSLPVSSSLNCPLPGEDNAFNFYLPLNWYMYLNICKAFLERGVRYAINCHYFYYYVRSSRHRKNTGGRNKTQFLLCAFTAMHWMCILQALREKLSVLQAAMTLGIPSSFLSSFPERFPKGDFYLKVELSRGFQTSYWTVNLLFLEKQIQGKFCPIIYYE